ncbi:MAG TPA: glycosyltransferase [Jiangellales bacterium]|nr:glycosyltransferase [Jiangellales bacterium]
MNYSIVIPTVARPSLYRLLASLANQDPSKGPEQIVVVDDRPGVPPELDVRVGVLDPQVVRSGANGPAAARNVGWRKTSAEWVVFLDDDVVLPADWARQLASDLAGQPADVAGVQARIRVPLPARRLPTDGERNTAGLASAAWITADMAYRRKALEHVGGFDERFRRAYREDADLAVRVQGNGWRLIRGRRETVHPVRLDGEWASVRAQAGNADDALMRRRHGPSWREAARAPRGRLGWHVATTACGSAAVVAGAAGVRRTAVAAAAGWLAMTMQFALLRIKQGPATPGEIRRMLITSIAIPPAATVQRLLGEWRHRNVEPHVRERT